MPDQNHLKSEKSPYLLQHADNPVNWYPWCEDAFNKAQEQDKPVFVSIGYATCHWCHVMAHESFEDEEVAQLMNEHFINIKVDREERPDIDNTYMLVCQMLTGNGGWPLTIIMTPDKKPFFAATYIPKKSRFGRPGLVDLIPRISELWNNEREKILNSAKEIAGSLSNAGKISPGQEMGAEVLDKAYHQLSESFDDQYGGFNDAPKFPSPHNLVFLLRYAHQNDVSEARDAVTQTLEQMRKGGIYDHVGFGFHRYSTDRRWLVPHFEKMLYDQAMLMMAYTEAWQVTQNPEFKNTVEEIYTYISRDMTDTDGAFYSAEDADSEGEEGKFYVWSVNEVREVLDTAEVELIIEVFNMDETGNYKDEASGQKTGKNILHLTYSYEKLARERSMELNDFKNKIEQARNKLFNAREQRVHPLKDDKILTDWNGLMIAALARAGRVFQRDDYTELSNQSARFILNRMYKNYDILMHRFRDGQVAIKAHADDYAFLIWGLIELYETTFEIDWLEQALELNDQFIKHFWDEQNGGFFFTGDFADELLGRQKQIYDGAAPSGNSVAMMNLLRLAKLTSNHELEEKAARINRQFSGQAEQYPTGHTQLLQAVQYGIGSSFEVVIAGDPENNDTQEMLQALRNSYIPNKVVLLHPETGNEKLHKLAPFISNQTTKESRATAYVCQNHECNMPTTDIEGMLSQLGIKSHRKGK